MSSQVTDNSTESRYELHVDGRLAGVAVYHLKDDSVIFTHTEIDSSVGGHGHGSTLVRAALDDVRSRGLTVVPLCPFVKAYIEKHQEYADLLKAA
jgi:predicted GNAT family acetyltransferase